jgi:hypothetical protein
VHSRRTRSPAGCAHGAPTPRLRRRVPVGVECPDLRPVVSDRGRRSGALDTRPEAASAAGVSVQRHQPSLRMALDVPRTVRCLLDDGAGRAEHRAPLAGLRRPTQPQPAAVLHRPARRRSDVPDRAGRGDLHPVGQRPIRALAHRSRVAGLSVPALPAAHLRHQADRGRLRRAVRHRAGRPFPRGDHCDLHRSVQRLQKHQGARIPRRRKEEALRIAFARAEIEADMDDEFDTGDNPSVPARGRRAR